jgi:hypothetical protein
MDGYVLDSINTDGQALPLGRPARPTSDVWRVRATSVLMFAIEPDTSLNGVRVFATPETALAAAEHLDRTRLVDEPAAISVRQAIAWALSG